MIRTLTIAALTLLTLFASCCVLAQPLSLADVGARLALDPERISLSGLSAGAFMAQQFHVAHSSHVIGVGLIAGGPYRCAAIRPTPTTCDECAT